MSKESQSITTSYIYLHIAVFLWGFTAILGKLISYDSLNLVWHRMVITALVYLCLPNVWKFLKQLSLQSFLIFCGIGVVVTLHWLTFYGSIKLGNSASITLACLGTASIFSALFDPFINKRPFDKSELLLGLWVVAGLALIYFTKPLAASKHSAVNYQMAILTGIISAALAALFTAMNKRNIHRGHPVAISAIEMLSGAALLTAIVPVFYADSTLWVPGFSWGDAQHPANYDLIWVLILAILCTNLTFFLGTKALQHLSAFTANLTVNLEPVYGIVLGALLLNENRDLNVGFYIGASMILLGVFAKPILSYLRQRELR